jgi:sugar O-acyltransferase (sialic acid O-acetyltransferase NeuD family)
MSDGLRLVVIGASGFGRECLDVVEAMIDAGEPLEIVGVVDDAPSPENRQRLADRAVSYLGTIDEWLEADCAPRRYVLGVGDPGTRRRLVDRLDATGVRPVSVAHPSATFGARSPMGEGTVVCSGATISTNVQFGRHVHVNPNATIGHDAALNDFVSINPSAVVSGEVVVFAETLVGAAATILQGLAVGRRSVVGAGAVVTKSTPEGVVVKGVPGVWAHLA